MKKLEPAINVRTKKKKKINKKHKGLHHHLRNDIKQLFLGIIQFELAFIGVIFWYSD